MSKFVGRIDSCEYAHEHCGYRQRFVKSAGSL
jgi:hypothetical protein